MTTTKDPTFAEALQAQLERREPIESPFAPTPTPRAHPMEPGTFPTPHADAVLNPRIVDQMTRDREAYIRRISNTPGVSAYEFKYDVFVVHRPPGACFECRIKGEMVFKMRAQAAADGSDPDEIEPGFDFHTCPHNRRAEYVALMNRKAANEISLGSHREETLPSGVVQVCMSWGEPKKGLSSARTGQNTNTPKPSTL